MQIARKLSNVEFDTQLEVQNGLLFSFEVDMGHCGGRCRYHGEWPQPVEGRDAGNLLSFAVGDGARARGSFKVNTETLQCKSPHSNEVGGGAFHIADLVQLKRMHLP